MTDDAKPKHDPSKSGRKGGLARREKLTSTERKAIAAKAARARWGKASARIPRATHEGPLKIGDLVIPCAVLEDGRRVVSERGFTKALGRGRPGGEVYEGRGGVELPIFLALKGLKPFIPPDFSVASIPYLPAGQAGNTGTPALGVEAALLPKICKVWVDAWRAGALRADQLPTAMKAEILRDGFAEVGIIALVDEATGYQAERDRDELRIILEQYIVEEMRQWVKTFPAEFFKQVYRLHGWTYKSGDSKTPRYVGKFIDRYVYKPLPPGVRDELRSRNPVVNGRRKHKHFMFLTEESGAPHLEDQIRAVTLLMKGADNKPAFQRAFTRVFATDGQLEMDLPTNGDDGDEA